MVLPESHMRGLTCLFLDRQVLLSVGFHGISSAESRIEEKDILGYSAARQ